jgi:hypothetical protein
MGEERSRHRVGPAAVAARAFRRKARGRVPARRPSASTSAFGVVHPKARPAGGVHAHMLHQGLGAVVARAHRHALLVEHGRDVVGMAAPSSVNEKIAPLSGDLPCTFSQFSPSSRARAHSRVSPPHGRRCSPCRRPSCSRAPRPGRSAARCRRAGLELHRRIGIGDGVAMHLADHVAATHEGAHLGHALWRLM